MLYQHYQPKDNYKTTLYNCQSVFLTLCIYLTRYLLSDGSSFISAKLPDILESNLAQLQIIKIHQSKYISRTKPIIIKSAAIAGSAPLVGKPKPFSQYMEQGFGLDYKPSVTVLKKAQLLSFTPSTPPPPSTPPITFQIDDLDKLVQRLPQDSSQEQGAEYLMLRDICPGLQDWRLLARIVKILPNCKPHQVRKGKHKGLKVTALNFLIIDQKSDQATCVAYGDVADRLLAMLKQGLVYQFSKCQIKKLALSRNTYISIMKHSKVRCIEKHPEIPTHKINPFPFNRITDDLDGQLVDVLGIIQQVGLACTIKKQDGTQAMRLQFQLIDLQSKIQMRVFFWQQLIGDYIKPGKPIIIKNIKINSYKNSLHLISTYNTFILPNTLLPPNHPAFSHTQIAVYSCSQSILSIAQLCKQLDILHNSGKDVQSRLRARVIAINQRNGLHYMSCTKCLKKVNKDLYCQKCQIYVMQPIPKYLINCLVADATGQLWVTIYSQNAECLMGCSIQKLIPLSQQQLHEIVKRRKYTQWILHVSTSKTQSMVRKIQYVDDTIQTIRTREQLRQLISYMQLIKIEQL